MVEANIAVRDAKWLRLWRLSQVLGVLFYQKNKAYLCCGSKI